MGQQGGAGGAGASSLRSGSPAPAEPECIAAFERKMKQHREQQLSAQQEQESRAVSGLGRLFVAVAVLLPSLSYMAATYCLDHGPMPLVLPNELELKVLTQSEATEASPDIKKAAGEVAWTGASKKESHWTGKTIAPSGQVLARVLMNMPELVHDNRVVELGSGCGVVGLTGGVLGARETYLTDQVTFMAKSNLDLLLDDMHMGARSSLWNVRVRTLQWGDARTINSLEPPFDLVLGSDILYRASDHDLLAATVERLSNPSTVVLVATPAIGDPHGDGYERCLDGIDGTITCSDGAPFFDTMKKLGFVVEEITSQPAVQKALVDSAPVPSMARDMLEKFTRRATPLDVRVMRMQLLPPEQRLASRSLRVVSVQGKLELRQASKANSQRPPPPSTSHVDSKITCADDPCYNGACITIYGRSVAKLPFKCECTNGWEGDLCDRDTDECASAPCRNGGHCFDSLSDGTNQRYGLQDAVYGIAHGEYRCACGDGYVGANCDTEDEAQEI